MAPAGRPYRIGKEVDLIIPQWVYRVEHDIDAVSVTLSGELDMDVGEDLAAVLADAVGRADTATVHVELRYVTFIDCATISVLVDAYRAAHARGRRFIVRGAVARVRRVLEVTGVLAHLAGPDSAGRPSGSAADSSASY
jgi:anti-anti-sigma factor